MSNPLFSETQVPRWQLGMASKPEIVAGPLQTSICAAILLRAIYVFHFLPKILPDVQQTFPFVLAG